MAPFTVNDIFEATEYQQKEIDKLRNEYEKLKAWTDLNDHYIRELIDTLGETVDKILRVVDISEVKLDEIPKMIAVIRENEAAEQPTEES